MLVWWVDVCQKSERNECLEQLKLLGISEGGFHLHRLLGSGEYPQLLVSDSEKRRNLSVSVCGDLTQILELERS